jgi:hypothetical protein
MWSWALKVPLDGQSFLGTHTGNVLTDVDVPILCIQSMQKENGNHRFYDTL